MTTTTTTQVTPASPPGQAVNTVARREFGGEQLEVRGETASTVMAAEAKARVEARFIIALKRPRDWDEVRARLLRACERPGFAGSATEKPSWGAAWYRKPVGEGVEGFSVRFAEEVIRCMGNIDVEPVVTYEDDRKRMVAVSVLDLETNVAFRQTVVVQKTVERAYLKRGQEALSVRVNSLGKPTYLVEATEDEIYTKQQALQSKVMRNGVLRLLPGDIQAECRERILQIRLGDVAKDPAKVQREVADAFTALNVLPAALKKYLGHELGTATPAELAELRALYKAIRAGEVSWHDALNAALEERGEPTTPAEAPAPARPALEGLTEKLKAEQQEQRAGSDTDDTPGVQPGKDGPTPSLRSSCPHPDVPPSVVAALGVGGSITCKACGEVLTNPDAKPPAGKGQQRIKE